jgi:hypothetical protein
MAVAFRSSYVGARLLKTLKWIAAAALLGLLHACGFTSLILPPLVYSITSTVYFTHAGERRAQAIATKCSVVDQTRTIAGNYSVTVTGERHWISMPDQGILVLGILNPCRWHQDKPPRGDANRTNSRRAFASWREGALLLERLAFVSI